VSDALRVVLVLRPVTEPHEWLALGELRGHPVEYLVDGTEALVRIGDWISPSGPRPVIDELREMVEKATGLRAR
jgi:hypothetical protein